MTFNSGNEGICADKEDWCAYEPDCKEPDVITACPKYCKTCKSKIFVDICMINEKKRNMRLK